MKYSTIKIAIRSTSMLLAAWAALQPIGARCAESEASADAFAAWDNAGLYLFEEAHREFKEKSKTGDPAEQRAARFGEALTLLNVQPKTRGNIENAAALFSRLTSENPDDEIGISAKYYLARIAQVHRFDPDFELAEKYYLELANAHPEHLLGQLSLVKYAMLQIYAAIDPAERERRFEALEALGSRITDPDVVREFHMFMADACARYIGKNEVMLGHLIEAQKIGFVNRRTEANVLVRIGETARLLGQNDIAREYFSLFVERFPRDNRNFTVRQRIANMQQEVTQ